MFSWIFQLEKQVDKHGGIDQLIQYIKSLGINDVCIKYHEGSGPVGNGVDFRSAFLKYKDNFKQAGFKVGTWGYNYFNHIQDEADMIIEALNNSDYYIFDPEVDVSGKTSQAEQICQLVRAAHPNKIIGYSTFPIVEYHQDIPYSVFNKYCDFASPQCYWGEMEWSMNHCISKTLEDHKNFGLDKPIYPSVQTYNVSYDDMIKYIDYKFKYTGLWVLDDNDSTFDDYLHNRSCMLNAQESSFLGSNNNLIKEVQHDLQRCSCLDEGESNATGVLDSKTLNAIATFKDATGVPGGVCGDGYLIDALNVITHKPTVGEGWNANPIAVRFLQWYFGLPKTGIVDGAMTAKLKEWQVKAGIWSSSGADGVIREKDWSKILK